MRPEYDAIVAAATAHVLRFVGADACTSRVACFLPGSASNLPLVLLPGTLCDEGVCT